MHRMQDEAGKDGKTQGGIARPPAVPGGTAALRSPSFLHLPEPLRSDVYTKVLGILKSGGLFAGEFFSIHQMPRTTGGPKDETLLYTAEQLQAIFERHSGIDILELCELDTELSEGRGHVGIASVVRMAVRKS